MARPQMPKEIAEHVRVFEERLAQLAEGAAPAEVVNDILRASDQAIRAAQTVARQQDKQPRRTAAVLTSWQVIGFNLGQIRRGAGISQAELATAMDRAGFPWKRITVAEVEGGKRRTSIEELLGLAAVFGVPVVRLLVPHHSDCMTLTDGQPGQRRVLDAGEVEELLVGQAGKVGRGGAAWQAARRAAGLFDEDEDDWRPAAARDRRVGLGYGEGRR